MPGPDIIVSDGLRDAGLALAAYLSKCVAGDIASPMPLAVVLNRPRSDRLRALELGSGCGIVGLALAQARARTDVLLTDLAEAADIVQANLDITSLAVASSAAFKVLSWGQGLPETLSSQQLDLALVADCTYNPGSAPALVKTLRAIADASPAVVIVVATKVRHPSEAVFFDLMAEVGLGQTGHVIVPLPTGEDPGLLGAPEVVDIYTFGSAQ